MRDEVSERPTQLDRIEAALEALSALIERLVSGDPQEDDRAREGFRAYRKRMGAK
jgi:hypothetical protein